MSKKQDMQKKSDRELAELVTEAREAVRAERFKDRFSRKANVIRKSKLDIARALTEISVRRRNQLTK